MKGIVVVASLIGLVMTAGAAPAAGSKLSIGLGQGVADGYTQTTVGSGSYLSPTTSPETNLGAEF